LSFTVSVTIFPAGQENGLSAGAVAQTRPEAPKSTLLQVGTGGVAATIFSCIGRASAPHDSRFGARWIARIVEGEYPPRTCRNAHSVPVLKDE
jgi:hypothetical protein